ncbi:hypothetical protein M0805_009276 [Coniferiporia weirii]|nr:hypothetical protein M0805_009276 [Coniferiporia weirii]
MSIRVYALWEKSRRVLAVLVLSILAAFILVIALYSKAQSGAGWFELSIGTFAHCVNMGDKTDNSVPAIFAVLMSLDCVIALLTAWKGRYSTYQSPLVVIFYRDGLLYFVCLFAANFVILQWRFGNGNYYNLLIEMQRCFRSVVSARIILNMREASKAGRDEVTLGAVSFAIPISETSTFESARRLREEMSTVSSSFTSHLVSQEVTEINESLADADLSQIPHSAGSDLRVCAGHRVQV